MTLNRHRTLASLLTLPALLALTLLLTLALAGCGGGGTNGSSSSAPAPAPAPVLSASAVTTGGLTATLAEDKATVASGGTVTYTLTLTNDTTQPVTFLDALNPDSSGTLPGGISQITDARGSVVYPNGGPNSGTAPPTTSDTLAPHQSLSQTVALSFPYPAGRYTTTADFQAVQSYTPPPTTTAITLSVTVQ